jgi:hypothetical protein
MKTVSIRYLLVLLILSQLTRAQRPESTLLLGTIQFPSSLKTIEAVPVIFRGTPLATQIDQSNKTVTFSLFRDQTQFNFNVLIAEPDSIMPVYLSSKYHSEPSSLVAYQRIKTGHPYRFFVLTLIPEISKDPENRGKIIYSWRWREDRLSAEYRIPDDALIIHAPPAWVAHLSQGSGFNFPTVCMSDDLGSEEDVKKKWAQIAIAGLDIKPLQGRPQEQVTKLVGNTKVIAPQRTT